MSVARALTHFQNVDPVLHAAGRKHGLQSLKKSENYFDDLCETIVSQQLSGKVATVLCTRLHNLFAPGKLNPRDLSSRSIEELRTIGISNSKARFLHDLAERVTQGVLSLEKIDEMSDEEISELLTQVKGIGPWTVDMFLMFTLGREDVFSFGDLGLKRAIQRLYGLKEEPTKERLEKITQKWSPYRTYACRILWKSLDNR